jgi:hypothetical protein
MERLFSKAHLFRFYFIFSSLFHLEKIIFGPYAPVRMYDYFDGLFTKFSGLAGLFAEYGFTHWDPLFAAGIPTNVDHFGMTYLLVLLSTVFPIWLLHHGIAILFMAVAGYGMFLFLNRYFDVAKNLSVFAGLFFALNTQIYPKNVLTVFPFVYPFLFVCLHGFRHKDDCMGFPLRLFWVVLFSWMSYPTLVGPGFAFIHLLILGLIVWFQPEAKNSIKTLFSQYLIYWAGYCMMFVHGVYSLLNYIPYAQQNLTESSAMTNLYEQVLGSIPSGAGVIMLKFAPYSITLALEVAGLILLWKSPRVLKSTLVLVFMYQLIYILRAFPIFSGTFLENMHLSNLSYGVNVLQTFHAVILAEALILQTRKVRLTFILISLISYFVLFFQVPFSQMHFVFKILNGLGLVVFFMVIESLTKKQPFTLPTSANRLTVVRGLVVLGLVFSIVAAIKFVRAYHSLEKIIYKSHFESHPILDRISEEAKSQPFRVGFIDIAPSIGETYLIETLGGKRGMANGFYKKYMQLMVSPQLSDPKKIEYFQAHEINMQLKRWYRYSDKGKTSGIEDFVLPLILAANTKYLISGHHPLRGFKGKVVSMTVDEGNWYGSPADKLTRLWEFSDKIISNNELLKIGRIGDGRKPIKLFVYELKNFFPRAYLASEVVVLSTQAEVMEELLIQDVPGLREKIFITKEDLKGLQLKSNELGSVSDSNQLDIISYKPDRIIIEAKVESPKMVMVSNNYSPHWKALVDGLEVPLIRSNLTFQAIYLTAPGSHRVELIYSDPSLNLMYLSVPFGFVMVGFAIRLSKIGDVLDNQPI